MKTGRRTQTFRISGAVPFYPNLVVNSVGGRNLEKYQLGGVIFGCKNNTMKECQSKLIFGLPANHFSYVKNIDPGLPIFLFNYSDRKLHGIFEASSKGKMYIDPYAWIDDNSELDRTQYPAQVKVRVRLQCQPLSEDIFAPVIAGNYYSNNHFWFELDHRQANKLTSLLASLAFASGCNLKWKTVSPSLPSKEGEAFEIHESETQHFTRSNKRTYSTEVTSSLDGDIRSLDTQAVVEEVSENEFNLVYEKLKKMALGHESQDLSLSDNVNDTPDENDACTVENDENENDTHDENDVYIVEKECHEVPECLEKEENSSTPIEHKYSIDKLIQEVEELMTFKQMQIQNNCHLEQKLREAELKIQHLMDRSKILESASSLIQTHVEKTVIQSHDEQHIDPEETLFVKVFFDAEWWLSTIDLYWSFQLMIKSLYPMNSTSMTQLNFTKVLDLDIGKWISPGSRLDKVKYDSLWVL
ncbi:hypothetical protein LR48_Vigan11g100200 [Vigna angularis]|uniref:DCD domain-containing protein n=1 Tax=Phaseolus angularis TaxID=3914 RepID=A0A0L9VTA3_PHAAN|nr:hypothetical protein LR48_Vigan11g100200 [Vigna angularis]